MWQRRFFPLRPGAATFGPLLLGLLTGCLLPVLIAGCTPHVHLHLGERHFEYDPEREPGPAATTQPADALGEDWLIEKVGAALETGA